MAVIGGFVALAMGAHPAWGTHAASENGEIEGRPSPTYRRECLGGTNAGAACKEAADCPGSSCADRNVFNITIAVMFDATDAELQTIEAMITATSAWLFDVTDGQAEIGSATIHDDALSTANADLVVWPSTNNTWWQALSGHYRTGGYMEVSIDEIINAGNGAGSTLAHEFVHLVFDARDEYESRAANCGAVAGAASCPVAASGVATCVMDSNGSELCWGQADPTDLTDVSGGVHDPTNVTEQSSCRDNRSCWAQIAWAWPATFRAPTGAPDPAAGGAVVNPTDFIRTGAAVRVVLVLDESGSMGLESPSRMERLQVAATDFVQAADADTEVGIVSFSDDAEAASGRAAVAIAALGNNRATWTTAIDGLAPTAATNVGAGLDAAKDQIVAAGGVTANTYIVLMTDGLNNRPSPPASAAADLQAKIDDLLASGIPVYVTCTGGDLGLESQCAEIAAGTNGHYADAADAGALPQAFIDFHERITGRQAIGSVTTAFSKLEKGGGAAATFFVDAGARSASFSVLWDRAGARAAVVLVDPAGTRHPTRAIRQGAYARIANPVSGDWRVEITSSGADSAFTARAYVHNPRNELVAYTRRPTARPGDEVYLYAFAKSRGGSVTEPGSELVAEVTRPDGTRETIELRDDGRDPSGHGDDMARDGIYTGVYTNTGAKGGYSYRVSAEVDGWHQGFDAHRRDPDATSPRFLREAKVSSAVNVPGDVEPTPDDEHTHPPGGGGTSHPGDGRCDRCHTRIVILLIVLVVLVLIVLVVLVRCCRRLRKA